jgi:hypothetical protein
MGQTKGIPMLEGSPPPIFTIHWDEREIISALTESSESRASRASRNLMVF